MHILLINRFHNLFPWEELAGFVVVVWAGFLEVFVCIGFLFLCLFVVFGFVVVVAVVVRFGLVCFFPSMTIIYFAVINLK